MSVQYIPKYALCARNSRRVCRSTELVMFIACIRPITNAELHEIPLVSLVHVQCTGYMQTYMYIELTTRRLYLFVRVLSILVRGTSYNDVRCMRHTQIHNTVADKSPVHIV